jgi:hypothetical protein
MNLTKKQLDIIHAKTCPYCKSATKKISQEEIYGKRYGNGNDVICCVNYPRCDSYVGTHSDGTTLGRLANYQLRIAKKKAHASFDKLWKEKLIKRSRLYKRMSAELQIPREYCHIGMFQISTCYKVEEWAFKLYNKLKNENI